MNIEKLEMLLKKVETAAGIIHTLRDNEKILKTKNIELVTKIDTLQRENAELKDHINFLNEKLNTSEMVHSNIEQKIISILDKLPDFDAINIDDTPAAIPAETETVASHETEEVQSNHQVEVHSEESHTEDTQDDMSVDTVNEVAQNETTTNGLPQKNSNDFSLFKSELSNSEVKSEEVHDQALPHFEETEESEELFTNMFAFDDMIDDDSEKSNRSEETFELPRGVM